MRTATTMSLLILTGMLVAAGPLAAQGTTALPSSEPQLKPTWFNPQTPQPGETYPLAVVLESNEFPDAAHKFWVSTLYAKNFCQCVVRNASNDWSNVSVNDVLKLIDPLPGNVPADGKRLVLVADSATAPLAMRLIDGFPNRVAGAVFVSARPVELTLSGQATVWLPRRPARAVPMWIVVGTSPGEASKVLSMWRTFHSLMPPDASITIDTRLGRSLESLLPDKAIADWLAAIVAGKTPTPGPDAQAEQLKTKHADVAAVIDQLLQQRGFALPAGQTFVKADGPMTVSVVAPQGWARYRDIEKTYNPSGKVLDEAGKQQDVPPNPFLQIGLTPGLNKPLQGLVLATQWDSQRSAADLIAYTNKRLTSKGYASFPMKQWTAGDWAIELTAYTYVWQGQWQSWLGLSAARDARDGEVAAPLLMLLSRAEKPNANTMVAALNRLRQTVQVEWTGPPPAPTPTPIED